MLSTQPAPLSHQLPRGHLLVLNRSFRRTLEAENKSPRTIEAYTDAVRLLASYCQAHGHPVCAGELEREHIQVFISDLHLCVQAVKTHAGENQHPGPSFKASVVVPHKTCGKDGRPRS